MKTKHIISPEGKRLLEALRHLKNGEVKVGWFEKSKYANGTPVAGIAAQNEFGNPAKNIPARPFMRPTIQKREKYWIETVKEGAQKVLGGHLTVAQVLDLLGSEVEGDIKKAIKQLYYPALAESTVLARINRNKKLSSTKGQISEKNVGNITKPLVDTGIMYNTLTHEVTGV
jgi:hypothetical protein